MKAAVIASCVAAGGISAAKGLVSPKGLSIHSHRSPLCDSPEALYHVKSHPSRALLPYVCNSGAMSTTHLNEKRADHVDGINAAVDGSGRGLLLMALSLMACVWIFSIPPEYRRAHICSTSVERGDCIPLNVWVNDVKTYYRNGGGVHFDFTIDQSTRDYWSGGR
jgi:hypothetical protein